MKTKTLTKAAAGAQAQTSATLDNAQHVDLAVQPSDRLNLHSPQAALVGRKRTGKALELEFDDGQKVALDDFYVAQAETSVPTLIVSTANSTEVIVGSIAGVSEAAEGPVEGTVIAADTRDYCAVNPYRPDGSKAPGQIGTTGEPFAGFPQDDPTTSPYCINGFVVGGMDNPIAAAQAGSLTDP
ncbi:MAG: hypothetical protein EOO28_36685, partial [Comamonadaceae bacterium]